MIIKEIDLAKRRFVIKKLVLSPLLSDQYLCERIESIESSLKEKHIVWIVALSENPKSRQGLKGDLESLAARFDSLSELTLAPVPFEDGLSMILSPKLSPSKDVWARRGWTMPPFSYVLVKDEKQHCLGLMTLKAAEDIARTLGFDAVVTESHWPRICDMGPAGSQRYRAQKELKERNKPVHYSQRRMKGCRVRMRIAQGDLERKLREIRRHLTMQHRVRVRIQSYGRARKDSAGRMRLFSRIVEMVGEAARPAPVITESRASLLGTFIPS
ncbi:MAG: hypothetical protein P1V97_05940 [Planctomycetota bacterium]|nr:hypothetical protein [Planctomycetota bacterium]